MLQRQIDIVARLLVKKIAFPLVLMMTALERYMALIAKSQRNLYLHSFFLLGLIIIALVHFYL